MKTKRKKVLFYFILFLIMGTVMLILDILAGFALKFYFPPFETRRRVKYVRDGYLFWHPENIFKNLEKELVQSKRKKRFLNLGDSVTMGLDVGPHENYSVILETLLNQNDNAEWKVINLGVEEYSSLQVLRLMKKVLPEVKPEIITVLIGWNDHWEIGKVSDNEVPEWPSRVLKYIPECNTVKLIQKIQDRYLIQQGNWVTRVPLSDFEKNIEDMISLAEKYNSRLIFILPVYYQKGIAKDGFEKLHLTYIQMIEKTAEQHNIETVDFISYFADKKKLFVIDPHATVPKERDYVHPSHLGHEIIAKQIIKKIYKKETEQIR